MKLLYLSSSQGHVGVEKLPGLGGGECHCHLARDHRVVPLDRLTELPKTQRDMSVGAGGREHRRDAIDVLRLPRIEECRTLIDHQVRRFNFEMVPKRTGMPRVAHYARDIEPAKARKGVDILGALETKSTFVNAEGITHHADGRQTSFAYQVDGVFSLLLDAPVTYKADPLLRGIFAAIENRTYWLPPKITWASEPGRAEEVARQDQADSRFAAAQAIAARELTSDSIYGPGAFKADQVRASALLNQQREQARAASGPPDPVHHGGVIHGSVPTATSPRQSSHGIRDAEPGPLFVPSVYRPRSRDVQRDQTGDNSQMQ